MPDFNEEIKKSAKVDNGLLNEFDQIKPQPGATTGDDIPDDPATRIYYPNYEHKFHLQEKKNNHPFCIECQVYLDRQFKRPLF
jgi:hypothetical protein